MPTVTVRRDKGYADKLRKYRILVDGVKIGTLAENTELRHKISDEPHVITAKIDWCGCRPLQLQAQPNNQVVLVRSALRGWRIWLAIFYVIFNTQGYLILELQQ